MEEIKTAMISAAKNVANKKLQPTDWYVIRKAYNGKAIPQDIIDQREAILSSLENTEALITAAATQEDLNKISVASLGLKPVIDYSVSETSQVITEEQALKDKEEMHAAKDGLETIDQAAMDKLLAENPNIKIVPPEDAPQ